MFKFHYVYLADKSETRSRKVVGDLLDLRASM